MSLITKDRQFYKTLYSLSWVIVLQNLITFGVNLADNIMIGAYSQNALNGVSMVNQIQFLLQMIAGGIANGMCVISAQYWGQRKTEPIKRIFAVGFWLGLILSAAITAVSIVIPDKVLGLLTNEAEVIAEGAKYLRIIAFTYCIFTVTTVLLGILRSVETVKIGFYVSLTSLLVNIGLNYVMIYGLTYRGTVLIREYGIRGAAIATLIARVVEFCIVLIFVIKYDKKLRLKLLDLFAVEKSYIRDFAKAGLPLVLSSTSWGIAMSIQTAIIGRLGSETISANSIAATLFSVISVLTYGVATASGVVIGKTVGAGQRIKAKEYAKTLQLIYLAVGVVTSIAMFGCRGFIVEFYKVTQESAELARSFILVLCITVIGTAYQMSCLTGIVSGGGQTNFVLYNDLIFMWGIVLPASLISAFVLKFPPVVTFACLKSDQILKCAVAVVKVNRFRWIRVLTR